MTYDNVKLFFAITHRPAICTCIIILIFMICIVGTFMISEWLMTTILSGNELQSLENYEVFSN